MAIDTAAKRLSAMNVGAVAEWGRVYPTGSIGQAARQDVIGVYRGILASAPPEAGSTIPSNVSRFYPILFGLVGEAV